MLTGLLVVGAQTEAAAQDRVYSPSEVTKSASVRSRTDAATAIQRAYPSDLMRRGVSGRVQLQFVVRADGSVDPATVTVLAATVSALGEAATQAVRNIRFTPGEVNGRAVPTEVVFPIAFEAGK